MLASAPANVEVEVTAIPVAIADEAKVPVPFNVTTSGEIIPVNVPVMVAEVVPSYIFVVTAALEIVKGKAVMFAVTVGAVTV